MSKPRSRHRYSSALSRSRPGSSTNNNDGDIEAQRRRNERLLQGRFQAIFAKYDRDFGDSGDVIDLVRERIVIDNGHLKGMRHDTDIGGGRPRLSTTEMHSRTDVRTRVEDELSSSPTRNQPQNPYSYASNSYSLNSIGSFGSNPGNNLYNTPYSNPYSDPRQLAQQAVSAALPYSNQFGVPNEAFIQEFSQNIANQVAGLMYNMHRGAGQVQPTWTPPSMSHPYPTPSTMQPPARDQQWVPPSIWRPSTPPRSHETRQASRDPRDACVDDVESSSTHSDEEISPIDRTSAFNGRGNVGKRLKWSKEEDDLIMSMRSEGLDWDVIEPEIPPRSATEIKGRYYYIVRRRKNPLTSTFPRRRESSTERPPREPNETHTGIGNSPVAVIRSRSPELPLVTSRPSSPASVKGRHRKRTRALTKSDARRRSANETAEKLARVFEAASQNAHAPLWSAEEDKVLVELKVNHRLTFGQIASRLGRSRGATSKRYSRLVDRPNVDEETAINLTMSTPEAYDGVEALLRAPGEEQTGPHNDASQSLLEAEPGLDTRSLAAGSDRTERQIEEDEIMVLDSEPDDSPYHSPQPALSERRVDVGSPDVRHPTKSVRTMSGRTKKASLSESPVKSKDAMKFEKPKSRDRRKRKGNENPPEACVTSFAPEPEPNRTQELEADTDELLLDVSFVSARTPSSSEKPMARPVSSRAHKRVKIDLTVDDDLDSEDELNR